MATMQTLLDIPMFITALGSITFGAAGIIRPALLAPLMHPILATHEGSVLGLKPADLSHARWFLLFCGALAVEGTISLAVGLAENRMLKLYANMALMAFLGFAGLIVRWEGGSAASLSTGSLAGVELYLFAMFAAHAFTFILVMFGFGAPSSGHHAAHHARQAAHEARHLGEESAPRAKKQ